MFFQRTKTKRFLTSVVKQNSIFCLVFPLKMTKTKKFIFFTRETH